MAISRNRSAGAKVTDEEYTQLEALAQARGVTLGEWCREVLLRQLTPEAITSEGALLGEVLTVRMIVLDLFRPLANGGKLSDAKNSRDCPVGRPREAHPGKRPTEKYQNSI